MAKRVTSDRPSLIAAEKVGFELFGKEMGSDLHFSHMASRTLKRGTRESLNRSAYVETSIFATSFAEATARQESYDVAKHSRHYTKAVKEKQLRVVENGVASSR
jgi:hypothetical protein